MYYIASRFKSGSLHSGSIQSPIPGKFWFYQDKDHTLIAVCPKISGDLISSPGTRSGRGWILQGGEIRVINWEEYFALRHTIPNIIEVVSTVLPASCFRFENDKEGE